MSEVPPAPVAAFRLPSSSPRLSSTEIAPGISEAVLLSTLAQTSLISPAPIQVAHWRKDPCSTVYVNSGSAGMSLPRRLGGIERIARIAEE